MRDWIRDMLAPLTELLREYAWSMPLGQGIHLLGISLLLGAAVLLYPRLIGSTRDETAAALAARLLPWMWRAFAVIAVTGFVLFTAEPVRLMRSPVFRTKMIMLVIAIVLTLFLQRRLRREPVPPVVTVNAAVGWIAGLSLTLWIAIAASGRLIGYGQRLLRYFFG